MPPGQPAVPETLEPGFEQELATLVGADAERTFAVVAALDEHHPSDAHWYLWFLGVHPAAQGRRLGSGMLTSMLERCDREGQPAYLDATSEDNRRLYERHGFEVIGEISAAGSPPLRSMWRQPQRAGQRGVEAS